MDGAEVFRAVRRRSGLSQRRLAERSSVALSTISGVEAGRHAPTLAVLEAVLAVAGLELAVDLPPAELAAREIGYLRHSLVRRVHHALGGSGNPRGRPIPRWAQLVRVAQAGQVALPDVPDLQVVADCPGHVGSPAVAVFRPPWRVHVDPPSDLALQPSFATQRRALRAVARLLHQQAAQDEQGRRARAHRDPDHEAERAHVFHTKRFGQRPMPDPTDTRSWRLDDDASLAEWLRRYGCPV